MQRTSVWPMLWQKGRIEENAPKQVSPGSFPTHRSLQHQHWIRLMNHKGHNLFPIWPFSMGTAVAHGGVSTLLAFILVAFSNSYVYLTFFKVPRWDSTSARTLIWWGHLRRFKEIINLLNYLISGRYQHNPSSKYRVWKQHMFYPFKMFLCIVVIDLFRLDSNQTYCFTINLSQMFLCVVVFGLVRPDVYPMIPTILLFHCCYTVVTI